jgi:hypothetical protein
MITSTQNQEWGSNGILNHAHKTLIKKTATVPTMFHPSESGGGTTNTGFVAGTGGAATAGAGAAGAGATVPGGKDPASPGRGGRAFSPFSVVVRGGRIHG